MTDRMQRIRNSLEGALAPESLELIDDSHKHVGHAGARDGRGHFSVRIVASCFQGQRPLARHRMVYVALGALMDTDIHALSIQALTPEEIG
ncbi:MAG: BolA family protein [Lysobacterales bacterium]